MGIRKSKIRFSLKKQKTILIVAPTPPPYGGGEIMCEILVQGLRRENDFRVLHINAGDSRGNANRGKIDFINVSKGFLDLLHLIRIVLVDKPDIVYIPIAKDFMPFLRDSLHIIIASLLGATVVCHLHGGAFNANKENGMKKTFVNFALKRIHTLVFLGENLRRKMGSQFPIENFAVLYNGIEPIPQPKSKRGKERNERFHVLFIGNLRESKGLFDVLKAASLVLQETDQIDFWLAGEWQSDRERDHALSLIKQYGIEKHIRFWGLVTGESKAEFFNHGDLLVHPTYYDGQPIVILEAMSAGLPVISTDIGSIAETIMDKQNGFIVPTGRPDEIAEKILLLYRDDGLRKSMSSMSREIYRSKFTTEVFLANAQQIFHKI